MRFARYVTIRHHGEAYGLRQFQVVTARLQDRPMLLHSQVDFERDRALIELTEMLQDHLAGMTFETFDPIAWRRPSGLLT
jgi:hypothetical protein